LRRDRRRRIDRGGGLPGFAVPATLWAWWCQPRNRQGRRRGSGKARLRGGSDDIRRRWRRGWQPAGNEPRRRWRCRFGRRLALLARHRDLGVDPGQRELGFFTHDRQQNIRFLVQRCQRFAVIPIRGRGAQGIDPRQRFVGPAVQLGGLLRLHQSAGALGHVEIAPTRGALQLAQALLEDGGVLGVEGAQPLACRIHGSGDVFRGAGSCLGAHARMQGGQDGERQPENEPQ